MAAAAWQGDVINTTGLGWTDVMVSVIAVAYLIFCESPARLG
jgi:hypothetical protein